MSILDKILGDANAKYLKKLQPLIENINQLESEFKGLSDSQLKEKTKEFKGRLNKGETLDSFLPEAFALVREASSRTLNQKHYDVQLLGGIVLHQNKIAEMRTGEGKTLAATLPAYLNALTSKGVHIITVNDYLAKRDMVWMGQIYDLLGLSVGCIVHDTAFLYDSEYGVKNDQIPPNQSKLGSGQANSNDQRDRERDEKGGFEVVESYLRPCSRREAYSADITYGTNNEFGFDYLRDNMAHSKEQQVQRGFNFAIIDEVDSVLIDEARTPLIISAPDQEASKWYQDFARIVPRLDAKADYEVDEKSKTISLTEPGIEKIEKILGMSNIYEEKGIKYLHHLEQALRAQAVNPTTGQPLFDRDKDYVVKNGEVIIVDDFTGRLMPGRRWSGGLHQAIEAKEGVAVKQESITLASITFQNYFRLYKKLAGMTGTALTSAEEFHKVYNLETIAAPTNKPMIRKDLSDRIYKTEQGKFQAIVKEVKKRHERGQPILIGTRAIERNEYLGKLLDREGINHKILNAKHHEQEAQIIAQAGRKGAVTVATNMAGRGVDIILGGNPPDTKEIEQVKEFGGLYVLGTERHEARRIDNQLRGRTGRQGDPGASQFFISLEDDLMRIFGGDKLKGLMERLKVPDDEAIEVGIISKAVESAQSKIEGMNFDMRKHILEYDDVMNKHREVFYKKRREILEKSQTPMTNDQSSANDQIPNKQNNLRDYVLEIIKKQGHSEQDYIKKEKEIGRENMQQVERAVCLQIMDSLWKDHLYAMEHLRDSVRLRAYGQQDPLVEYKKEGHKMFQEFLAEIESSIAKVIMKAQIKVKPMAQEPIAPAKQSGQAKIGRNQPCPCGSGKKYKKCHGGNK